MKIFTEKLKHFYANNPWTRRISLLFISLVIISIIIRIALTPTIIQLTASWLKNRGIDATIEDIRMHIIGGKITLVNATGTENGQPLFNIGLIDIHWLWKPLSDKTIQVTHVELDHLTIRIKNYTDSIVIGGVKIPLSSTPEAIDKTFTNDNVKPWAASLGEVVLSDLDICYLQHSSTIAEAGKTNRTMDYCVKLNEMQWAGTISYAMDAELYKSTDLPLSSTGNFTLNGLTVTDNILNKTLLDSELNSLNKVVINGLNNIQLDSLTMNQLHAMHRDDDRHKDSFRFSSLALKKIALHNLNNLSVDSLELKTPGLYIVKNTPEQWEYQQWIPDLATPSTETAITSQQDSESQSAKPADKPPFRFAINSINIDDADFCYLDKTTSLYYCYTHKNLTWSGPINYGGDLKTQPPVSLNGNLKLTHSIIYNKTIDRELIAIDALDINKLIVTGQNARLANFEIDELSALQRGKKDDDTVSFTSLKINDVDYNADTLAINTIDLKGLKGEISKNKEGSWEFDKWLPESKDEAKNEADKNQKSPATSNTDNQATKTNFDFAINKINIDTKESISFTDNSTTPPLTAGLTTLSFNLAQLNSKKPDIDSPIKLFAKTSRYATIDVEGSIRPLAENISFDARGKLRGIDLRAATPLTKKTIGHIIKSGQMDADLTLLSKDGQLDSNIALSLYHFNIKSISRKDSKELDDALGIPLNQTLVLLRDKDDSIHLDIPITGDIDNPNFDPMDAIVSATTKAATISLITFYTPYGLIYAGGNLALTLATALNFDPVLFASGSSELITDNKEKLDKLSRLLTEKPQVRLTLCGVSNKEDTFALYPEIKKQYESSDNKTYDIKLTEVQSSALETLAMERQTNSKNYLVDQHTISHERLILCEPEHSTDDEAISGVEINIK